MVRAPYKTAPEDQAAQVAAGPVASQQQFGLQTLIGVAYNLR